MESEWPLSFLRPGLLEGSRSHRKQLEEAAKGHYAAEDAAPLSGRGEERLNTAFVEELPSQQMACLFWQQPGQRGQGLERRRGPEAPGMGLAILGELQLAGRCPCPARALVPAPAGPGHVPAGTGRAGAAPTTLQGPSEETCTHLGRGGYKGPGARQQPPGHAGFAMEFCLQGMGQSPCSLGQLDTAACRGAGQPAFSAPCSGQSWPWSPAKAVPTSDPVPWGQGSAASVLNLKCVEEGVGVRVERVTWKQQSNAGHRGAVSRGRAGHCRASVAPAWGGRRAVHKARPLCPWLELGGREAAGAPGGVCLGDQVTAWPR